MAAEHGSRTRYNAGCRCDACKLASRDYDKMRRQRMLAGKHAPATVTKLPTSLNSESYQPGPNESAVMAEIAGLSTAASHPGLVAVAIRNAQVLDSPLAIAQVPSSSKVLMEALEKLRKGADGKTGRLASVRQMTRKPSEAAG